MAQLSNVVAAEQLRISMVYVNTLQLLVNDRSFGGILLLVACVKRCSC